MSITMRLLLARSTSTITMRGINGARRRAFSNFCYDDDLATGDSESESEFQWPIEKGEVVQSPPEKPKMMMKESEMMKKKEEETEERKGTLSKELFKRPHEEFVDKLKEGKERSSKTKELVTNDSETKGNLFSDFRDSFKRLKESEEIRKRKKSLFSEVRERMKELEIKKMNEPETKKSLYSFNEIREGLIKQEQKRKKEMNLRSLYEFGEEIKKSMNGSEIKKSMNGSEIEKINESEMKKKNIEETEEKIGGFRGWEIRPPPPATNLFVKSDQIAGASGTSSREVDIPALSVSYLREKTNESETKRDPFSGLREKMNESETKRDPFSELGEKMNESETKKKAEETEEKIGRFRGWEIKLPPPGTHLPPKESCSRVAEGRSSGGPTQEKEGREEEENALSDGDKSMFIHFMNAFTGICKTMSRNMELEHKYSMAKCMEAYRSIGDGFTPQEDLVVYRLFKVKDNREFFLGLEDWKRALWLRNMFTKK